MFGDIINHIPGLGHANGLRLYVVGDFKGGNKAMRVATRSFVVMVGGAIGSVGGPTGVAVGATLAGATTDAFTSIVADKPHGYVKSVMDIGTDILNGEFPAESLGRTGFLASTDVAKGFTGPTLRSFTCGGGVPTRLAL